MSTVQPQLVSKRDAGRILGLSVDTIDRLIQNGDLAATTIRNCRRIFMDSIDAYIDSLRVRSGR